MKRCLIALGGDSEGPLRPTLRLPRLLARHKGKAMGPKYNLRSLVLVGDGLEFVCQVVECFNLNWDPLVLFKLVPEFRHGTVAFVFTHPDKQFAIGPGEAVHRGTKQKYEKQDDVSSHRSGEVFAFGPATGGKTAKKISPHRSGEGR